MVLDTIMEFVKVGNGGKFHSLIFHKLILAIVSNKLYVVALFKELPLFILLLIYKNNGNYILLSIMVDEITGLSGLCLL